MKKLLILGANSETIPLVQEAVKSGIEVHVTDPDSRAPAKEYADVRVDIDASNGVIHVIDKVILIRVAALKTNKQKK